MDKMINTKNQFVSEHFFFQYIQFNLISMFKKKPWHKVWFSLFLLSLLLLVIEGEVTDLLRSPYIIDEHKVLLC